MSVYLSIISIFQFPGSQSEEECMYHNKINKQTTPPKKHVTSLKGEKTGISVDPLVDGIFYVI